MGPQIPTNVRRSFTKMQSELPFSFRTTAIGIHQVYVCSFRTLTHIMCILVSKITISSKPKIIWVGLLSDTFPGIL